jgi:hypothetical protein
VLDLFEITADYSLNVMTNAQTPTEVAMRVSVPPPARAGGAASGGTPGARRHHRTFAAALAVLPLTLSATPRRLRTTARTPFEELNRQMTMPPADGTSR